MKRMIILLIGILITTGISAQKNYKIIKEEKYSAIKKVKLYIRINNEINETELKEIALKLKRKRPKFKQFWIYYLLPGNIIGNGAWATTHFNPELELKILGPTKELLSKINDVDAKQQLGWIYQNAQKLLKLINQLLELVELQNWLMVTTPMAKGLISDFHPLYRGVFGLGGHESARDALLPESADYVVVVGTALDEITTGGWDTEAVLSNRIIHISQNSEHLSRSILAKACILGSPKLLLEQLFNWIEKPVERPFVEYMPGTDGFPKHIKYSNKDN